jgi:hypothetical protein
VREGHEYRIWTKSPRMTAPGGSGVVRWWDDIVGLGRVLSFFSDNGVPETRSSKPGINYNT